MYFYLMHNKDIYLFIIYHMVHFAIGLVILVLNLPDGQVLFFLGNSNYRRIVINPSNQTAFWG